MKINKFILIALALILIISISANLYTYSKISKTAYVDLAELFDQFHGKKELEVRMMGAENQRKSFLDSLGMEIQFLQSKVAVNASETIERKLKERQLLYQQLNQEFQTQFQEDDQQYTQQIWSQINQYIKEYGDSQGYDYIYGSKGDGSLMYTESSNDITSSVLNFINKRYEGA